MVICVKPGYKCYLCEIMFQYANPVPVPWIVSEAWAEIYLFDGVQTVQ